MGTIFTILHYQVTYFSSKKCLHFHIIIPQFNLIYNIVSSIQIISLAGFKEGDVFAPIICRQPNYCTAMPTPPPDHGLQAQPYPSVGIPEYSYLTFNCSDTEKVMYKPPLFIEKFSDDYVFQV